MRRIGLYFCMISLLTSCWSYMNYTPYLYSKSNQEYWEIYKNKEQKIILKIHFEGYNIYPDKEKDTAFINKQINDLRFKDKLHLDFSFGGRDIRKIDKLRINLTGVKNGRNINIDNGLICKGGLYDCYCNFNFSDSINSGIDNFDLYPVNQSYPEYIHITSDQKDIFNIDTFLINLKIDFIEFGRLKNTMIQDTLFKKMKATKVIGHS